MAALLDQVEQVTQIILVQLRQVVVLADLLAQDLAALLLLVRAAKAEVVPAVPDMAGVVAQADILVTVVLVADCGRLVDRAVGVVQVVVEVEILLTPELISK